DMALSLVGRCSPVSLPAGHFLDRTSVTLLEPIQVLENVTRHVWSVLELFPDGSERSISALSVVVVRGHLCLLATADYVSSAEPPSIYSSATGRARACTRDSTKAIPGTVATTTLLPALGEPGDGNSPADQPYRRS